MIASCVAVSNDVCEQEEAAGMKMNNMFSCLCEIFLPQDGSSVCVCVCERGLVISVMVLLSDRERKKDRAWLSLTTVRRVARQLR